MLQESLSDLASGVPSQVNSQRGHLLAFESQPHMPSLCVEGGTGEKTQRKLPARIFKMSSRCGHKCGASPLLFEAAKLVCVVTDNSASPCPGADVPDMTTGQLSSMGWRASGQLASHASAAPSQCLTGGRG